MANEGKILHQWHNRQVQRGQCDISCWCFLVILLSLDMELLDKAFQVENSAFEKSRRLPALEYGALACTESCKSGGWREQDFRGWEEVSA